MELSFLLMKQILSMGIMILMGFCIVKAHVLKSEQSTVLSALCMYLICPCTVISAFQVEYSPDKMQGLMIATMAAILLHIVFIFLAWLVNKRWVMAPAERASLIYSNGANLIIPLVSALLGPENVFYTSAFIAIQLIYLWTHGFSLMSKEEGIPWKKILLNPNMIAIVIGVILFVFRIELPGILQDTITNVGSIIGPVCMFMIGMVMGGVNFRQVFSKARLYLICAGRLLVYPLIIILCIRLTGITLRWELAKDVLLITMLATCAPVAVSITQFANIFGTQEEARDAGAINVMSVIFCIITMPAIIWVYQVVC